MAIQPSGEEASIKWITVGGRTSAVVQQVQKLNAALIPENKRKAKPKKVAKVKANYIVAHPADYQIEESTER